MMKAALAGLAGLVVAAGGFAGGRGTAPAEATEVVRAECFHRIEKLQTGIDGKLDKLIERVTILGEDVAVLKAAKRP